MELFNGKKKNKLISVKDIKIEGMLILLALLIGAICGVIGGAFAKSISLVTELRAENQWLVYLLPVAGLVSVGIYKLTKTEGIGTLRALESARGEAKTPIILVPVIFVASVLTHLFGGSAGKEGAALQIGSGIAEIFSKITKADDKMRSALTMCGMAGLFSAAFGTPVGACVFALEIAFDGSVQTLAVLPAAISSVTAFVVAVALGGTPERFHIGLMPDFGVSVLLKTVLESAVVAAVGIVFCWMLIGGEKLSEKLLKNPLARIFIGGCVVIILTLIFGTDYNGGGMAVIERVFETGTVRPEAFLLKIIFTVVTVCAGYKGGEIVPSLFIGATLGAVLSPILGLPVDFCAAIGITAFFARVTNCPIASAFIAAELFGTEGFLLFAVAAFVPRVFSDKISLYQRTNK